MCSSRDMVELACRDPQQCYEGLAAQASSVTWLSFLVSGRHTIVLAPYRQQTYPGRILFQAFKKGENTSRLVCVHGVSCVAQPNRSFFVWFCRRQEHTAAAAAAAIVSRLIKLESNKVYDTAHNVAPPAPHANAERDGSR